MYELDHETVLVSIDDIKVGRNITNIRTHFPEESVIELAQSIYEDGLLQAIIVMDCEDPVSGDDIVELVAGARRLRAIKHIVQNIDENWTCDTESQEPGMVKATQFSGDSEDAEFLNGVENIEREEVDDVDIGAWLHRMVEENGKVQHDLALKLHKSQQWVSSHITVHRRGSELLKKAMRPDFLKSESDPRGGYLIAFSTAYELAKRHGHEDQDELINKAIKSCEKLTLEEAQRSDDPNKSKRPSKKGRELVRAKAEDASAEPEKYPNARGVAMALRWVDGLLDEEEILEIIHWLSDAEAKSGDSA